MNLTDKIADQSRVKHLAAHADWEQKLSAVNENGWKDQEMIKSLANAHQLLRQAIGERINKDPAYRKARKKKREDWWAQRLQLVADRAANATN